MNEHLTVVAINHLVSAARKPGAKRVVVSDGATPGLSLRVEIGGSAHWDLRYSVKRQVDDAGKTVREFETKDDTGTSLADARAWASERRAMARAGINPVEYDVKVKREQNAERQRVEAETSAAFFHGRTVKDFFEGFTSISTDTKEKRERGYLARHVAGLMKSREMEQLWRNHILPAIGEQPVRGLSRGDVVVALEQLQERGLSTQVNRIQAAIAHFLGWMVEVGNLDVNIAAGMKRRVKEHRRKRVLENEELRHVWMASEKLYPVPQCFLRTLILTGQRRDDVREMQWSELRDGGTWVIAGERYKVRRAHEVMLPTQARDAIDERREDGSHFVFSGRDLSKPYNGPRSLKAQIDKLLVDRNLDPWVLHDIRRTVRTGMAALGISDEIAERVIGHARDDMVETYNRHHYRAEKQRALQAWADHVEQLVVGPGNVVSLADWRP